MIKTIKENILCDNNYFKVCNNDVIFERTNKKGKHLCISTSKGVDFGLCILPITSEGKVCVIKEFRYAINKYNYSLIKGGGSHDKGIFDSVNLELLEEANLSSENIEVVSDEIYENPSFYKTEVYFIIAHNCRFKKGEQEDTEVIIEQLYLTDDQLYQFILKNKIKDASSRALICQYLYSKKT
jgi:ADP-ribose pyrophosphatase